MTQVLTTARAETADAGEAAVDALVQRARAAMGAFESADQARVDEAVTALAWSIYAPERAKDLAELAVEDTGIGNVPDKVIKNTRKTFGTLRDLLRVKRSEEHTSELQSLMRISYAVFCLK